MNEADTRTRLIDPKLKAAGWSGTQVTLEFYCQHDRAYTDGRIVLVGNEVRSGEPRRVDYLLNLTDGFPIAVVEAKADEEPALTGLEQARRYAETLALRSLMQRTAKRSSNMTALPSPVARSHTSPLPMSFGRGGN